MKKITIKRYFLNKPRLHLAKVEILVDENVAMKFDGSGCEFISEVEMGNELIARTALNLAKALNCEIKEEKFDLKLTT